MLVRAPISTTDVQADVFELVAEVEAVRPEVVAVLTQQNHVFVFLEARSSTSSK